MCRPSKKWRRSCNQRMRRKQVCSPAPTSSAWPIFKTSINRIRTCWKSCTKTHWKSTIKCYWNKMKHSKRWRTRIIRPMLSDRKYSWRPRSSWNWRSRRRKSIRPRPCNKMYQWRSTRSQRLTCSKKLIQNPQPRDPNMVVVLRKRLLIFISRSKHLRHINNQIWTKENQTSWLGMFLLTKRRAWSGRAHTQKKRRLMHLHMIDRPRVLRTELCLMDSRTKLILAQLKTQHLRWPGRVRSWESPEVSPSQTLGRTEVWNRRPSLTWTETVFHRTKLMCHQP